MDFQVSGFGYTDPERSIAFESLEELSQYFEPTQVCVWCGGDHYWDTCSVVGSTGPIKTSWSTSLEQDSYENHDPSTNGFDWGNFQEPSYNISNHIPLEFQQEVQAGNKLEANTLELLQDESEEQVFDDCLDEEVEYFWEQIDEHKWRMACKERTIATPTELHTVEAIDEHNGEPFIEKAGDTLITDDMCEAKDNDGKKFVRTKFQERRPHLKKVKSKEERSHLKQTKKLSSSKRPLKRTHWNSGKRSRGRNRYA